MGYDCTRSLATFRLCLSVLWCQNAVTAGDPLMNGRKPTALEASWLGKCQQIPCLACSLFHDVHDTPAETHHIRGQRGKLAHLESFSLCPRHHRQSDTHHPKRWISRHGDGKRLFESRYMPEKAFLAEQAQRINALEARCA